MSRFDESRDAAEDNAASELFSPFRRLARGERAALGDLYDLVAHRLYGMALWRTGDRRDAEEVVQEVFVRLAERPRRLDRVREPLRYLLAMTHRAAVDVVRRRRVRVAESLDDVATALAGPEDDPVARADAERAVRLLAGLPAKQREVIYLRHVEECTFAEIARIVGAPLFTVTSRHRLGLSRLRCLLGGLS